MTRQEMRDLDLEISFLEGIVRRSPAYVEALQILGDDYTRRGRFSEGLRVDERLSRLRPDDCPGPLQSGLQLFADRSA